MIVYLEPKSHFLEHVASNEIDDRILDAMRNQLRRSVGDSERAAWRNSLQSMYFVMRDEQIPEDAGVAIEFNIPQTSKRIDFIVTGYDEAEARSAVIVELKQWTDVEPTAKDAIVSTFVGGTQREMTHPSYQAWTYSALLEDYNETVREEPIHLHPCAYLHNCTAHSTLNSDFYATHTARAPAFLKRDSSRLRDFIRQHVRKGDDGEAMRRLKSGRIAPSKALADALASLIKGNPEFTMLDDQKIVYETALYLANQSLDGRKRVLIVNGGPGTGKTVVAVNLLVELTKRDQVARYVTKNAAPRAVYESKLTGTITKTRFSNLFSGSGSFTDTPADTYGALLVDEAHRLNEKSGLYANLGENQIKELIHAARCSVFFLDEDQRVTLKDIGENSAIRNWAKTQHAMVHELTLESQFRCNGSDGYLAWVNDALDIRPTANPTLQGIDYEFRVFDSPQELHQEIIERNRPNNKARVVAGYCWNWVSKKDASLHDIHIPNFDYSARWNLNSQGSLWIINPDSVSEVGCIHTCQGLELEYVGVILGEDLVIRGGKVVTQPEKRARTDKSLHGLKALARTSRHDARRAADRIIKNTYRTLMTRGQKGCFVSSVDPETNEYLRDRTGLN